MCGVCVFCSDPARSTNVIAYALAPEGSRRVMRRNSKENHVKSSHQRMSSTVHYQNGQDLDCMV